MYHSSFIIVPCSVIVFTAHSFWNRWSLCTKSWSAEWYNIQCSTKQLMKYGHVPYLLKTLPKNYSIQHPLVFYKYKMWMLFGAYSMSACLQYMGAYSTWACLVRIQIIKVLDKWGCTVQVLHVHTDNFQTYWTSQWHIFCFKK